MSDIQAKLAQTSFAGGIWSELLAGRTDFAEYTTAVGYLNNFLIHAQGPVSFRPGFKFIAGIKDFSKTVLLVPFEFSNDEAYILEFGNGYIRFFQNQAPVLNVDVPYEIAHPYTESELLNLRYVQSADVLYLFHKDHKPKKLMRLGQIEWVLSDVYFFPPPITEKDFYLDAALTLSATSGNNVSFTLSAALLLEGDVGRLLKAGTGRASIVSFTDGSHFTCDIISPFEQSSYASGEWHLQGSPNSELDPDKKEPKNLITYLEANKDVFRPEDVGKYIRINSGLVLIVEYVNAQRINGQILKVLSVDDHATNWTLESEMWTEADGYPCCGTFFEERLFMAGSKNYPETVWGSVVGDYENFAPGIDDSDSIQVSIASRKVNTIKWIEPASKLILGTQNGEWCLGPEDSKEAITPLNIVAKLITTKGCVNIPPLTIDGSVIFVQRAWRKIRELAYDFAKGETGGFSAPDLTQLAVDLTQSGIVQIAYQQEPLSIIWAVLNNGQLIALTYQRDAKIVAWQIITTKSGDKFERVACIPGADSDEVWAVVARNINGQVVRYIECLQSLFTDTGAEFTANKGLNAFFVDSGYTYNGASTKTVTGLSHLEGETVSILANGAVKTSQAVTGGQITIDTNAEIIHIGLPYSGVLRTLRINAQLPDGSMQAREKRIVDIFARVKDSGSFIAGRDAENWDLVQDPNQQDVYGEPFPLFTGDLQVRYEEQYNKAGQVYIAQVNPLPLTLLALYPEVQTS